MSDKSSPLKRLTIEIKVWVKLPEVRNGEDFSYIECMLPLAYQLMAVKKTSFPEMERGGSIVCVGKSEKIGDTSRMVESVSILEEPIQVANALSQTVSNLELTWIERVPQKGCQILGGKLVCWSAKKQSSVATSSAEVEYVAADGCCAQVLWIKTRLADYDFLYDKVLIFCDNTSAIAISNNPVLHSWTKHIDIRYHFIRDYILKGDIELHFVPTDLQLADIVTKPLAEPRFTRLVAQLGMINIEK
ncbi:hypothetical protein Tco_0361036 [Tanacetum coccineum]